MSNNQNQAATGMAGASKGNELPSPEITWLYTHCRTIGMTCKSDSGKWEHDIALFTINLQQEISDLRAQLARHGHVSVTD